MHLLRPFKRVAHTTSALSRAPIRPRSTCIIQAQIARMSSSMAQRLKGKTIVITGASSGIGKATAIEFAKTQPEITLILTARREDTLKEVAKEIEGFAKGVKVLPVKLDVSKIEEVQAFVDNLPQEYKDIDILVNNAYVPSNTPCLSFHPQPNQSYKY
jgi:NADP-dependent 3-hydroxy acid dehydrogenase YdfG